MKRLFAILLVVSLVISAVAFAEGNMTKITWGIYETNNLPASLWQQMIDAFEAEYPDIEVEPIFATGDRVGFWRTLYASGNFPDVLVEAQKFSNIEGLYAEIPEDTKALFNEAALVTCNDKYTLIPADEQLRFQCYYHIDEFEALGLSEPATWDEFINVCETIKAAGKTPLMCGGTEQTWATGLPWFVAVVNQAILNAYPNFNAELKNGNVKWNNEITVEELTRWQDMVKAGYYYEGAMALTYAQAAAEFKNGTAVMMLDGSWAAAGFDAEGNDKIGVFAVPSPTGINAYSSIIHYWGVHSGCKNQDAAWKFINYIFSNPEVISIYLKADGLNSATKEPVTYERGDLMTKFVANWADYNTKLEIAELGGDYALPTGMSGIINKSLQNIFNGADVASELAALDVEYQTLMDEA